MARTWIAGLAAGIVALTAAACSGVTDAPLAPPSGMAAAKAGSEIGTKVKVAAPEWAERLKHDVSTSAVIGPEGGVLALPATGLRVVVPAGAVQQPTTFGVTALAGKLVAYDFEPAGARFAVPLQVTQDLTRLKDKTAPDADARLIAGYFATHADLDQVAGGAHVSELLAATQTGDRLTYEVWHFSGYIVCWGRGNAEER